MNHFAHGMSHSRTFFHGLNQWRSLAALDQNACEFLRAVLKMLPLFMLADFWNSLVGGKFLFSSSKTSIALSAMIALLEKVCSRARKTSRILLKRFQLGKG